MTFKLKDYLEIMIDCVIHPQHNYANNQIIKLQQFVKNTPNTQKTNYQKTTKAQTDKPNLNLTTEMKIKQD